MAPEYAPAPVVVAIPSFTEHWYAGYQINPDSSINGGYPVIPAMPRRTRLHVMANVERSALAALAGTGTPGVWLDSSPFGSTTQGFFLAIGYFDIANGIAKGVSPEVLFTHTGPVYARYFLDGVTNAQIKLSWWSEIDLEQPTPLDQYPSFARDRSEGEPETTTPQPFKMEHADELDDYNQNQKK